MNARLVVLLVLVATAWYLWAGPISAPMAEELGRVVEAPLSFDHSISIDRAPLQRDLPARPGFQLNDYYFTLMAEFQLEALVLGRRDYRRDAGAVLAPIDLALGWGAMARADILEQFDIRQRGRFYFWRVDDYPIPRQEIIASSANMHLIPGNPEAFSQLRAVRAGQVVRLRGYLVNVDRNDGWRWRTSMTRLDTGDGACEVFLVTLAEVLR